MIKRKVMAEGELIKGMTPLTAHADSLATVTWEEMGLEFSESDYKAALKQIEGMLDTVEPGTPEGEKFEKLIALL